MVARQDGDDVLQGVLVCSTESCQREYPIIDGIPILVADVAQFLRDHWDAVLARDDLSPLIESLLGDCLGAEATYSQRRVHLSSYAHGHYADERGLPALVGAGIAMLSSPPAGTWLDVGCATGGACFALAAKTGEPVLGVDVDLAMLRFARRLVTTGRASYALRRSGVVYEQRQVELALAGREQVELWACDAAALPFEDGTFDGAFSLNAIDSVAIPVFHLAEMGRVLRTDAEAIISSPYDWTASVTELPRWIGGHSQRSHSGGSSVSEMRRLLSADSPKEMAIPLRLVRERERVPWRVYVHERATIDYDTHLIVARRIDAEGSAG